MFEWVKNTQIWSTYMVLSLIITTNKNQICNTPLININYNTIFTIKVKWMGKKENAYNDVLFILPKKV